MKHLFAEYRHWITKHRPFETIRDELAAIARQGAHFRRIVEPKADDVLYELVTFLDAFDIRTAYPLLLFLLESELSQEEWIKTSRALQSYLLRRAMCGLTTKNYNRVFLQLTRSLRERGASAAGIIEHLSAMSGDSTGWPDDETLKVSWLTRHAYQSLQQQKVVYVLRRLDESFRTNKQESIVISGPLTVEHIMPQNWIEHWPLSDGSKGALGSELYSLPPDDPRGKNTKERNALAQTLGNLTILTQGLNSSVSNSAWPVKRPEIMKSSLLSINQMLHQFETWDDEAIMKRGMELLNRAVLLWPRPARGAQ